MTRGEHARRPRTPVRQFTALLQLETLFVLSEDGRRGFETAPAHAETYAELLGGTVEHGPALTFPDVLGERADTALVKDVAQLERHFRGWTADELPGRAPIVAVLEGEDAVSVCFCARRGESAAEAGVETTPHLRGRGPARRVTAAWAEGIWASGRLPIYSTSWTNSASLALARKLGLVPCASDWGLYD